MWVVKIINIMSFGRSNYKARQEQFCLKSTSICFLSNNSLLLPLQVLAPLTLFHWTVWYRHFYFDKLYDYFCLCESQTLQIKLSLDWTGPVKATTLHPSWACGHARFQELEQHPGTIGASTRERSWSVVVFQYCCRRWQTWWGMGTRELSCQN